MLMTLRRFWHSHFYYRNMHRDDEGKIKGGGWRHGALTFYPLNTRDSEDDPRHPIELQWTIPTRFLAMEVHSHDGDANRDLQLHLGIRPLVALWLHITGVFQHPGVERVYGWYWHGGILWLEWAREVFDGQPITLRIEDWIFGSPDYTSVDIATVPGFPIRIDDDEVYDGLAVASKATWTYPRFRRPRIVYRVRITIAGQGIPIPGKGENSWDMGDDAIMEITTTGHSIPEAARELAKDIRKTRLTRGGPRWTPKEGITP